MLWRIIPQHPATLLAPRLRHTSGIVCTEVQQGPRPSKGRLIGSHRFRSHNEPGSNPRRFGGGVTVLPFQCPFSAFCSPQSFRRPIDRPLSQLLSTVVQVTPFHASFEGSCPLAILVFHSDGVLPKMPLSSPIPRVSIFTGENSANQQNFRCILTAWRSDDSEAGAFLVDWFHFPWSQLLPRFE